jgi:hypothetical protein
MFSRLKKSFTYLLSALGNLTGFAKASSLALGVGAFLVFEVVLALAVQAWLLWEFWPFENELSQKLAYSEHVETQTALMQKINVLEFELDIDQQRVIQKVVAPTLADKGQPTRCTHLLGLCDEEVGSSAAKKMGFQELRDQLPAEHQLLTELENCTLKSPDDWICKSKWFRSPNDSSDSYIGKSDGDWIFRPTVSKPINWKAELAVDQWQCGGNLCFVMSMAKRKQLFQRFRNLPRLYSK